MSIYKLPYFFLISNGLKGMGKCEIRTSDLRFMRLGPQPIDVYLGTS
jgi:hypothetical protein